MSRYGTATATGALLLLAGATATEAQVRAAIRVPEHLADPAPATGALRQLICRGGTGLQIVTDVEQSPRESRKAAVTLRYRPSLRLVRDDYRQLEPNTCTWNPYGYADIPKEPGVVHFDLEHQGTDHVPDRRRMGIWMSDSAHFWSFYVDDVTNVSISHGAYGESFFVAGVPEERSRTARTPDARRVELRCRGGSGHAFARGGSAGTNLVAMTLTYRVAGKAAGRNGAGLAPGTCAWADRGGIDAEPGRITFVTAGNAQLKKIQHGSAVDRSPTAAERWPDAQTIPVYLTNPRHYWTFTVQVSDADSALRHGAWKPPTMVDLATKPPAAAGDTMPTVSIAADTAPAMPTGGAGGAAPGPSSTSPIGAYRPGEATTTLATPTTTPSPAGGGIVTTSREDAASSVSLPAGTSAAKPYDPNASTAITDPRIVFDIRAVQVSTGLDGATIRFEAAPNITPTVLVHTAPPTGSANALRFDGQPVRFTVSGTPTGGRLWRYVAASSVPLARGTQYWFVVDAPEGTQSRHNQASGQFRTLRQRVTLRLTEINLLSDGDADGDGELWFASVTCPKGMWSEPPMLPGDPTSKLSWGDGRHPISVELRSGEESVPDRFRFIIVGVEDDKEIYNMAGPSVLSGISCTRSPDLEPGSNSAEEWNSIAIDFDLTRYPGTSGGEQFVRRSKPLRNGSKLMFEVRGHISVTRE